MKNLRKFARGKECQIRVPSYCQQDPERTVLCHVRMAGISGMGLKAPDLLAAFGCQACHDVCDGRIRSNYSVEQRRLMLLEGMARTQALLIREEIVTW